MRDDQDGELRAERSRPADLRRHGRRAIAKAGSRTLEITAREPSTEPTAVEPNSLLIHLFSHAPVGFINTFTDKQVEGLNTAMVHTDRRYHSIDYRTSISFFSIQFYVTFLMGRERRTRERLAMEGQTQAHRVAIAYVVLTLLIVLSCLAAVASVLYLFEGAAGINPFEGNFNLRHAARGRWNVGQLKPAERSVVSGEFPLTL